MRFSYHRTGCLGTLAALSFCLRVASPAMAEEFTQDFRNGKCDGRVIRPTSQEAMKFLKTENEGLRIKLPASAAASSPVGIEFAPGLMGEFEVTLSFDIIEGLKKEHTGPVLLLVDALTSSSLLSLSRANRAGMEVYSVRVRNRDPHGNLQEKDENFPASTQSGKLRITRHGDKVQFLVADGSSAEPRRLLEIPDSGSKYTVQIRVDPKEAPEGIDLRLTDFVAQSSANVTVFQSGAVRGLSWDVPTGGKSSVWRWLLWGTVVLVLAAVGWWLVTKFGVSLSSVGASASTSRSALPQTPPKPVYPAAKPKSAAESAEARLKQIMSLMPGGDKASPSMLVKKRPEAPPPFAPVSPAALPPRKLHPAEPPKAPATPQAVPAPPPREQAPTIWDDEALKALEKKATDFLKVNPDAVSYGERHHFRFRFQDGKLHGAFVSWWEADPEAVKAQGLKGKEIEDRLPKKFEGQYEKGDRHGRFTYWDQNGQVVTIEYEHGREIPPKPPVTEEHERVREQPVATAATEPPAPPPHILQKAIQPVQKPDWDEKGLTELEERARVFLEENPEVHSYVERYRFRFLVANGRLHGPFVAWHELDLEALKSLGADRKEVEEKLPRRFAGTYVEGKRHGTFTCWDKQGRVIVVGYQNGVVVF